MVWGATNHIADVVWRRKMTDFVRSHPAQAKMLVGLLNDGGEKFEVSRFDQDRRAAFKAALGRHMTVSSDDIEASVKANLRNIGVLSEIQTAKETYANAKKYLAHLASTAVS